MLSEPGSDPLSHTSAEPQPTLAPLRAKAILFKLLLTLLTLFVSVAAAEVVLRVFFSNRFFIYQDEKSLLYQYDPTLGWFPIPGARERFVASRVFTVVNNSQGFRAA